MSNMMAKIEFTINQNDEVSIDANFMPNRIDYFAALLSKVLQDDTITEIKSNLIKNLTAENRANDIASVDMAIDLVLSHVTKLKSPTTTKNISVEKPVIPPQKLFPSPFNIRN